MTIEVGIVDYGIAGNIRSIEKALRSAGARTTIIDSPEQLSSPDKLVIPGVGSFPDGMMELQKSGLLERLQSEIVTKPTLGICLGMQILSRVGFEYEKTQGLGVFDAEVKLIECDGVIPHMGFSHINAQNDDPILKGIHNESFYFMHSYEVVNYKNIIALSEYHGHEFVSVMKKGHVYGVQFHPEKSREQGIELFKNFIEL
jgi:glutamine amidotransferase